LSSSNFFIFNSLLWSLAPPKLSLFPSTIRDHLFPKYTSPQPKPEVGDLKAEKEEVTETVETIEKPRYF